MFMGTNGLKAVFFSEGLVLKLVVPVLLVLVYY